MTERPIEGFDTQKRENFSQTEKTVRPGEGRFRAKKKTKTYSFIPHRLHKKTFLKWLRRTHAWCGFWGALVALLFGVSGIVLNHRGGDLKMTLSQTEVHKATLPVGAGQFKTPEDLIHWLKDRFAIDGPPPRTKITEGRKVRFEKQEVMLPENWEVRFLSPNKSLRGTYQVGSNRLAVSVSDNNFWAFLNRLHLGNGLSVGWVLFADSIAGALIMLCLTGMLLWTKLHGTRIAAMLVFSGAIVTAVLVVVPTLASYTL